jgi:hypothetical protein
MTNPVTPESSERKLAEEFAREAEFVGNKCVACKKELCMHGVCRHCRRCEACHYAERRSEVRDK